MKGTLLLCFFALTILVGCNASKKTATTPENDCLGKRREDCICTKEYMPVCGCDGKTYGNKCEAACAGVKKYTEGECDKNKE